MDHRRLVRLGVALSAIGLCLGLMLGTGMLPAAAIIEPVMRLLARLDAFPRAAVWSVVAAAGAGAGFLALAGSRLTGPPPPEPSRLSPGPRQALGEVIRAAESSPTARSDLAARLLAVAAVLRAPLHEVPRAGREDAACDGRPDTPALRAVLQACPGVPPGGYRPRLAQALTELEAHAEGRRG